MSQIVIGLVGGIASGKSTVASLFAEERPAVHLDADSIARKVLERPAVQRAVARAIPGVTGPDGTMDRQKLTRKVFSSRRALAKLEEITHPLIRQSVLRALSRAKTPLVLLDAALLQENGADALCDAVVYVACPARTRRRRAVRNRGWTEAEHRAREARQWSLRRKRGRADFVVDNRGDEAQARRDVRRILIQLDKE